MLSVPPGAPLPCPLCVAAAVVPPSGSAMFEHLANSPGGQTEPDTGFELSSLLACQVASAATSAHVAATVPGGQKDQRYQGIGYSWSNYP